MSRRRGGRQHPGSADLLSDDDTKALNRLGGRPKTSSDLTEGRKRIAVQPFMRNGRWSRDQKKNEKHRHNVRHRACEQIDQYGHVLKDAGDVLMDIQKLVDQGKIKCVEDIPREFVMGGLTDIASDQHHRATQTQVLLAFAKALGLLGKEATKTDEIDAEEDVRDQLAKRRNKASAKRRRTNAG